MLSVVVYDIPAISIHAPASGATDNRIRELALSIISIHAPASGATASDVAVLTGGTDFNPRSREWSDGVTVNVIFDIAKFQSTLPRVERQYSLCI